MKKKTAFTLVEIMIVVAVIALLAAIAIPNLIRARVNANEAAAQAALKSMSTAIETFGSINNTYPTQTTQLLGVTPPYLSVDYFIGAHNGYTFSASLAAYTYSITATPISSSAGTVTYTISTSGIITQN